MGAPSKLALHFGSDYAVAMLPGETTETATVNFGRCIGHDARAAAHRFVKRFNSQVDLLAASKAVLEVNGCLAAGTCDCPLHKAHRDLAAAVAAAGGQ